MSQQDNRCGVFSGKIKVEMVDIMDFLVEGYQPHEVDVAPIHKERCTLNWNFQYGRY